jgi:hypothetical protein
MALAAEFCPKGSESFTYAVLATMHNLTNPLSETSGAILYDHVFVHNLTWCIWISTLFTLVALPMVPYLKLPSKPSDR